MSVVFAVAGTPVAMPRPKARAMPMKGKPGKFTAQIYKVRTISTPEGKKAI